MYPYTLAASSSLAWPLFLSLFAHSVQQVYPYTLIRRILLPGLATHSPWKLNLIIFHGIKLELSWDKDWLMG